MSDEELFDVLRDFVASVGLPEGHVPSTKDLSLHGRKDLANIVRRRGHKFIKELLSNSSVAVADGSATVIDGSDPQKNLDDKIDGVHIPEETGQEEKLTDLIEESTDTPLMDDGNTNGSGVNDLMEESTDIPLMDDGNTSDNSLVTKNESAATSHDQSHILMEASLQEKVENFMKYGQLDTVEDDMCGDSRLNVVKEGKSSSSADNLVESEPMMQGEEDIRSLASVSNNTRLNGTLMLQSLPAPPTLEDNVTRDIYLSVQGQTDAGFDSDVNLEGSKLENEVEINRLRHMLHQKELELSRLKEDIEKEKQGLSILQSKAESEISKAQKLISEKDVELHAAEESLSGLVEAKVQYTGEGQMVEVAGSFNGWHQIIKMEPQPSSTLLDPVGSRKSRLWSTTLWLYPGVYEVRLSMP